MAAISASSSDEKVASAVLLHGSQAGAGEVEGEQLLGRECVEAARELLYKRLRVEVTDGRIFTGTLTCLDKQGNILIANTVESKRIDGRRRGRRRQGEGEGEGEHNGKGEGKWEERHLGLVLVPERHRKSCEVEVLGGKAEKAAMLALLQTGE